MAKPSDLRALIDLTKTTQTLVIHFQASLSPSNNVNSASPSSSQSSSADVPNPLEVIKATTTLLRSHTTTLSLLLLTPPLTPSAVITKIGDVSSGVLSNMVAAATYEPQVGQADALGTHMRTELKSMVRRVLGTWSEVLAVVLKLAEKRQGRTGSKDKDEGPTENERQEVLATTGVAWEGCDALIKLCEGGIVSLVVKKAEQWRSVLLDAVEELKEWGEDVEDEDDQAEGSEDEDGFKDEDEIFGAANKLSKGDEALKQLLDTSVKKLKMISMLYQALIKRRLKTFPSVSSSDPPPVIDGKTDDQGIDPMKKLDKLMGLLKDIPETVDDLASAFYDLDKEEAKQTLDKCNDDAKGAVLLVKQSWTGSNDEFTTWSGKWVDALDAA